MIARAKARPRRCNAPEARVRLRREAAARAPRRAPRAAPRRRAATCSPAAPTFASKPVSVRNAVAHPLGERGIDRARAAAPSSPRRPALAARSAARTDSPSRTMRRASRRRASWSGIDEHRARVALGQLAAADHREHVARQLEQAHAVRDRRLRLADALGDLAERRGRTRRAGSRTRAPPRSARGPRARRSRRGRAAACRGRRPRGRPRARSRCPPRARRASGARRRSARSRPRGAGGRRPAGSGPARGSTRRGPTPPRRRTPCAAGSGSGGSARPGCARARARRCRSGPRSRGRGRGAGYRRSTSSIATFQ